MSEKTSIVILGSTGSIGRQTLEVLDQLKEEFEIYALSANSNADLLIEQAKKYKPDTVVISNDTHYQKIQEALWEDDIKVYSGKESLEQIVETKEVKIVVNALLGFSGLMPTISAIKSGKRIALANKESLVVAGPIIADLLKKYSAEIIPIDSEHSAIFQCLVGELDNPIEKIYLTASGGPFREKNRSELEHVTVEETINHPNWNMGAKISVDSATMINKGFEMIEAQWLFGLKPTQIEIVMHPESIVHSMVQFGDGSIKAQMSPPDMHLPIQYALCFPYRKQRNHDRINLFQFPSLHFDQINLENYPNLDLTLEAMNKSGNLPCALNASNEIIVQAFLDQKISFLDIGRLNHKVIGQIDFIEKPSIEELIETDQKARNLASRFISAA